MSWYLLSYPLSFMCIVLYCIVHNCIMDVVYFLFFIYENIVSMPVSWNVLYK